MSNRENGRHIDASYRDGHSMTSSAERFSVRDRVVLFTGAGRGIGRAMALAFAAGGASLVLASRTAAEVEAVAAESRERAAALATTVDLRLLASIEDWWRPRSSTSGGSTCWSTMPAPT